MNKYEEIEVYVNRIIFFNPTNNYYILNTTYDEEDLVVVGNINSIDENQTYQLKGNYVEHPKYGLQFKAYLAQLKLIPQEDIIVKFLSSSDFIGIGAKMALKIYHQYQDHDDIIKAILDNPEQLNEIKGLNNKKQENLLEQLQKHSNDNGLFDFINLYSLDYHDLITLYNKVALDINEFIKILESNPFLLLSKQASFKEIDKVARLLNLEQYEFLKLEGFLYSMLKTLCFKLGSTYLNLDDFINFSLTKINFAYEVDNVALALDELVNHHLIVIKDNRLYDYDQYEAEVFIAEFINEFNLVKDSHNLTSLLDDYQEQQGIIFNNEQRVAIDNGVNSKLSIITGGPGTGKSTIVSALINIINKLNNNLKIGLVAPTGKASKRLNYLTSYPSMTIHKMLKYDMHTNTFDHNIFNPIEYDVLIIDEASMIDNLLFANLLKASFDVGKIILLGDYNQLPSVGQGQILYDLINSKLVTTTVLEQIYRQQEGSLITKFAYDVLKTNVLDENYFKQDEITLISPNDYNRIEDILRDYANEYQIKDIQILAPMYRGKQGIDNLNEMIQFYKYGQEHQKFNLDDYVLQLKNRNEDEIYNGDVGQIINIDANSLIVAYENTNLTYLKAQQYELTLAYALSIHKAQGNEYDEIILFLASNSCHFVDNKILYTACTRAKKKLTIIASLDTINQAIQNIHNNKRQTYLNHLLVNSD